jgi:hypothetical protein
MALYVKRENLLHPKHCRQRNFEIGIITIILSRFCGLEGQEYIIVGKITEPVNLKPSNKV